MMVKSKGALQPQDELSRRLGAQFRRIRESRGMGLRPLAAKIDRCYFLLRRHEAGAVMLRSDDLFRAAQALEVRPSELLYIDREGLDG